MSTGKKTFFNPEISAFCTQMSMILKSGISAAERVSILGADVSGAMQKFYSALSSCLEQGLSLGLAMQKCGRFPSYVCDMTEIGMQSAALSHIRPP